jgi:hypothetical protein
MNFQTYQRSSDSALANALDESFPPHQQQLAFSSADTITPSYSSTDSTSFGMPIPGPTSPMPEGAPVLPILSEDSASSSLGTAVASSVALNVAAASAEGQDPQGSVRHPCYHPECEATFTQKQVRDRHFQDKHLPRGTCPNSNCPESFTYPRGRPGLLKTHLKKCRM